MKKNRFAQKPALKILGSLVIALFVLTLTGLVIFVLFIVSVLPEASTNTKKAINETDNNYRENLKQELANYYAKIELPSYLSKSDESYTYDGFYKNTARLIVTYVYPAEKDAFSDVRMSLESQGFSVRSQDNIAFANKDGEMISLKLIDLSNTSLTIETTYK